jgi:flavin reductase (DIM6/NTAB) family NADH-FMN oxidoreductase RutF
MTMGLHMMMQHEPALIGVVLGPWDHTLSALQESGECVIAVPTIDLAQTVVDVGMLRRATRQGRDVRSHRDAFQTCARTVG